MKNAVFEKNHGQCEKDRAIKLEKTEAKRNYFGI